MLYTTGSSGSLVSATTGGSPNGPLSAPIGGFTLYGFAAGNNVNGLQIGDRPYMSLYDISADGFAADGSRGYYVLSTGNAGMEGVEVSGLDARNNRVGYCFDGAGVHGSFDYSRWNLHTIANGVALQLVNAAHCWGGEIILHGGSGTSLFADSLLVQIGSSSTDTAALHSCHLHIGVEAESGSSQIQDFLIQGQAGNSGIVNCYGTIALLNSTASWSAGSITGSRLSFYGPIYSCPLVSGLANSANTQYFFASHIVAFDSAA